MTSSKTTKRALFSSALAMVMCVAMLIGTTFAWFTDTASTSVNKIQAGTLDVALEMWNGTEWVNAEGETLNFKAADNRTDILWEPGCTYELPALRVVNKGKLALKYTIQITGIQGDAKLNKAIEWEMTGIGDGALLANTESGSITITGHMKEDAGNEYQGLSIDGISITVYATQLANEYDSNGNQYDANAPLTSYWDGKTTVVPTEDATGVYHIENAAQFVGLMNNSQGGGASVYPGKTIVLDCDIDLGGRTIKGFGNESCIFGGSFNGQGHVISNFKIERSEKEDYAGLFNYYSYGTLENLTVRNATVIGVTKVGALIGGVYDQATVKDCIVEDCTVIADRKVGGAIGYAENSTVSGCKVNNTIILAANTEAEQSDKVIGFKNSGLNETGNTATNVTVTRGTTQVAESVLKEGNTYFISGVAGLQWFNDQINKSRNSFNNMTIELISDIDMNGANWLPAGQNFRTAYGEGYDTVEFCGTFNGNNHTISNINIAGVSEESVGAFNSGEQQVYSVGFIGYTNGTVKNLTIKKANVTGYHYVGTIVGMTDYDTAIVNCHVEDTKITAKHLSDVQCGDKVGGIVGNLYNGIKDCTVKNTVISAGRDAGQVVGCAQAGSTVDGCSAENVTVGALTGCTGANIKNEVIGRDVR